MVVCDGFTGNVILKLTEGVAKMLLVRQALFRDNELRLTLSNTHQ